MKIVYSIAFVIFGLVGTAQFNPNDGQFQQGLFIGSSMLESPNNSFFPLNEYGISYAFIHAMGLDSLKPKSFVEVSSSDTVSMVFIHDQDSTVKPFQVIAKSDKFFLLCSQLMRSACDCKEHTYLFIPASWHLGPVAKVGFTSLKKDLVNNLNDYAGLDLKDTDFKNYCSVIEVFK